YEQLPPYYESIDEYVRETQKNSPYAALDFLRSIAAYSLAEEQDGKFRCRFDRQVLFHFDHYDLRPYLSAIHCPSLIVRGKESRVMREEIAREMSVLIPHARFAEIEKAAHPVHIDNPIEFQKKVEEFLADI
ncbi:MAG TPA: alpha/beta hydrolase, partial [Syntrophales bacterium]|nr:alpha/beta hydrolase [Syntrophales bacterium]